MNYCALLCVKAKDSHFFHFYCFSRKIKFFRYTEVERLLFLVLEICLESCTSVNVTFFWHYRDHSGNAIITLIYVKGKFLDLANPTNNVKELWMPNWKLLKVIFFNCVHKYSVNKGGGLHPIFSLALIIFKGWLNLSNLDLIFNGKSNFQYLPEGKEKRWLINFKGIDYDQYL